MFCHVLDIFKCQGEVQNHDKSDQNLHESGQNHEKSDLTFSINFETPPFTYKNPSYALYKVKQRVHTVKTTRTHYKNNNLDPKKLTIWTQKNSVSIRQQFGRFLDPPPRETSFMNNP